MVTKKKKINKKNVKDILKKIMFGCVLFLVLILFVAVTSLLTSDVEIESDGSCNTGFIGLDIKSNNVIQNSTCIDSIENYTCFKEDLQLKHINLKNIDGLNCQGKIKVKLPFMLAIFMD